MPPPTASSDPSVARATLWAGFFTNGVWDMLSVLVPLCAAALGLSAAHIGFIVAARSVLPAALSIHGGISHGSLAHAARPAMRCDPLPRVAPRISDDRLVHAVTRLASIVTPAVIGVIAQAWGIEASFYVVGVVLLVGIAVLAVGARSLARTV